MKCDSVMEKLDFDPRYLINNNIKTSAKKLIPPISLYKLKTNYPNLYFLINQKKRQERKNYGNSLQLVTEIFKNKSEIILLVL